MKQLCWVKKEDFWEATFAEGYFIITPLSYPFNRPAKFIANVKMQPGSKNFDFDYRVDQWPRYYCSLKVAKSECAAWLTHQAERRFPLRVVKARRQSLRGM